MVGYFAYHAAAPAVDSDAVALVQRALVARGPDGRGTWRSADGRVALAHTRLAVIAPGDDGAQPMTSADGVCVVSYNGEIYNHAELRRELEDRGHRLRGGSDTEVLLAMYREHGDGMLARLRGMFAFALWDGQRVEMLLARDAYGIKPLYYSDDGWTVRAASQVKALLADPRVGRTPDPAGWAGFYLLGSVPEPFTLHREVRAVPAGSLLRVGASGPALPRRWFSIPATLRAAARAGSAAGPAEARARRALRASVAAHLVSDVPVGLFLSSGIDSAALLGLMADTGVRPAAVVTVAFDEFAGQARDESVLARSVAERYGAAHHLRRVVEREFIDDLPRILAAMDQPSIDGVNTWFASKAAAERGLKVAISGLGGDELMGGYPSFRQVPRLVRAAAVPSRLPLLRTVAAHAARSLAGGLGLHPKVAGLATLGGSYPGAYLLRRGLFLPDELPALLGEDMAREGLRRLAPLGLLGSLMTPDPLTPHARLMALEAGAYLRNQLLRDADWAGMAHGVEIRTPLVDRVLLQELAPVLAGGRAPEGKRLLADAPARALPEEIARRAKTGFEVPLERWVPSLRANRDERTPGHVRTIRRWARIVAEAA